MENEEKLINDAKELLRLISAVCDEMQTLFKSSHDSITACADMIYTFANPDIVKILVHCWSSNHLDWDDYNQLSSPIIIASMYKCLFFIYTTFDSKVAHTFLTALAEKVS